jgi:peptide-methionine (S)-S-oxide reductase
MIDDMNHWLLSLALLAPAALAVDFPRPATDIPKAASSGSQKAVLAGGCFWCTEDVFEHVQGVKKVVSGYSGGKAADANYKLVSAGRTTHAEAIEITFDPAKISFGEILKIFMHVAHDPTQLDRQGPDWGKQYRSAIFYSGDEQKRVAEAYIKQLGEAKVFSGPIVTQLAPLDKFYAAEDYHQDFVANNPTHPYVVVNSRPKIDKLKKYYPEVYRK